MAEKKTWIIIAVVAVAIVLVAWALAWYFRSGPGSYRIEEADKLVEKANSFYSEAEKTTDDLVKAGVAWKEVDVGDKEKADKLAKEFDTMFEEIDPAQNQIEQSDNYLEQASKLSLPAWYKQYLDSLKSRNQAAMNGLDIIKSGLKDLSMMLRVYPDLSRAINDLVQFAAKMEEISKAFDQNNTALARTEISAADALLSGASQLITSANSEIQSKDLESLIQLIAKAKNLTSLMRQIADAMDRGDSSRVSQLKIQLDSSYNDIQKSAQKLGATTSFEDWFTRQLDFYLESMAAQFSKAINHDEKAKNLRTEHQ